MSQHYTVHRCADSNKGLYSKVNDKGNKVQQDQAGYIQKRQEEGITLGERLESNAPVSVKWSVLEATWHKYLSNRDLQWRDKKPSWAGMVEDIREFFLKIPKGSEVTVCIRSLDGLVLHIGSFFNFIAMITKDRGLKALVVFQIYKYNQDSYHPRMVPFRGLGSVIPFTGAELMSFHENEEDPTSDIAKLVRCMDILREKKSTTSKGLQNRNMFPNQRHDGCD
jgi:hypothetical protein